MPAFRFNTSMMKYMAAAISGIALAVLIHPGAGFAYSQEEQQACTPDAMRLCGDFVPNVDAITACMIQKKSQLSPQCRAFFRPGPEPGMAAAPRAGKPTSIAPKAAKKTTKTGAEGGQEEETQRKLRAPHRVPFLKRDHARAKRALRLKSRAFAFPAPRSTALSQNGQVISPTPATGLLLFASACGRLRPRRDVNESRRRFARRGCIPHFPARLLKKRTIAGVKGGPLQLVAVRRTQQCDSKANVLCYFMAPA
ncbi:hypothetical protein ACVWZZ_002783 [Bradyrhizobium sp. LM6.10]